MCIVFQGVREYSKPISLEDKVKVDLVIMGSVAVSLLTCLYCISGCSEVQ